MDSEGRDIIVVAHRHGKRRADEGLAAYVEVERAQSRTVPPLLCRARGIEKRRLDICHRSSQSAVCHCLREFDRDGPGIGG